EIGRLPILARGIAPGAAVAAERLGEAGSPGLLAVGHRPRRARIDGVGDLTDLPLELLRHHRALNQRVASPLESPLAERCTEGREVGAAGRRRRARRSQCRARLDRSVAVGTPDLDRRAHLAVELAGSVRVLLEVAVDAVHALFEMDVLEMHRLLE